MIKEAVGVFAGRIVGRLIMDGINRALLCGDKEWGWPTIIFKCFDAERLVMSKMNTLVDCYGCMLMDRNSVS